MTKFHLIPLMFISLSIFSCKKDKDLLADAKNEEPPQNQEIQHFDKNNSKAIAWDQLPAELKNAAPLETVKKDKKSEASSTARSFYSYSVGPWGGMGGSPFNILPPAGYRVYAIAIRAGMFVDALSIWFSDPFGFIYRHDVGGHGGSYHLHYLRAGEYIRRIEGRAGAVLDWIKFHTNYKTFGYGGPGGTYFSVSVPSDKQILGFYGRAASLVDRIGFYVYTR